MADEQYSSNTPAGQGSDYERSQDFNTTIGKARLEYRKGKCPIPPEHAVAAYLKARALWPLRKNEEEMLRAQFDEIVGDTPEEDYSGFWLVAPLRDGDGGIAAIQRTAINKAGEKVKIGERNDRITIGEAYGASIRLVAAPGEILHIAEGLEDAMSVARLFDGAICWAACGRRGMEEVLIPQIVQEVRICADNDPAGLESAQVLAMRMVLAGKKVRIITSAIPGEDPNDVLRNKSDVREPLTGWLGRIVTYAQWRSLSQGETETRLKALAKADEVTIAAIKAEWSAFIKAGRPRRALVKGGVSESIEQAVSAGYRFNRDGIKPNDVVNTQIALQRIGLTARLDLFDMSLYLESAHKNSAVATIPGAPLHGFDGAVKFRDELLAPLVTFVALKDNVTFSEGMVLSALKALAHANRHHSMQDWLNAHPAWDQQPRLHLVLRETFGIADTPLAWWGSKALFVGQALRILAPGAKVDVMPVLVGASGYRKSTFVREIAAGGPDKFTDAHLDVEDSRKVLEQTLGKTVVEWPEMASATKADWESLKAFLSKVSDSGRLAYGRTNTEMPRGYINVGTINDMQFIRSEIGSRRFLPLVVQRLGDFTFIKENRAQLWAEARSIAVSLIKVGELAVPPELWDDMATLRAEHMQLNAWAQVMAPFLEEYPDAVLKSHDVKQFLIGHGFRSVPDHEIGEAMKALGFDRPKNSFEFGKDRWRGWYRGERPNAVTVVDRLLRIVRNDAIGKPSFTKDAFRSATMQDVEKASDAAAHAPPHTAPRVIVRTRGPSQPKRPLH